ncbi:hypothetical protein [Glaciihabitans sp. dw_435]|uniref:hypothetical protein n=1 Tax=Glaciihabitans sp. dw_435 TaxID=2720081 RepID=UPI001BD46B73|nr:hypothetical protein [Glaciihabitans sp. dw_435]
MTAQTWLGLIGTCVTFIGLVFVFVKGRGENKNAVDARIDARMAKELERVYLRLDEQDKEIATLKSSDRTTKAIVRRWFHELLRWDRIGRHGEMPLPSVMDMDRLDLDPNEATIPADELAALRAAANIKE